MMPLGEQVVVGIIPCFRV